jgi:hypothetical protein
MGPDAPKDIPVVSEITEAPKIKLCAGTDESFICPTRNKAKWVERAANCIPQTYSPMEVAEILKDLAAKYDGPNKVRVPPARSGNWGTSAYMNATSVGAWRDRGRCRAVGNADDFAYETRPQNRRRTREFNPGFRRQYFAWPRS